MPQLLGVLAYYGLKRYRHLGHLAGVIIPPIAFFYFSHLLVFSETREIQSKGERVCGTFVGMMTMAILTVTVGQLVFGVIAQLILKQRYRANKMTAATSETNE